MKADKKKVLSVNVDDLDPVEVIDKKFEKLSADGAREMSRNYGAPDAKYGDGEDLEKTE